MRLRAGCLTGQNHSSVELMVFYHIYLNAYIIKKYNIFGYKGKQVRDNLSSLDVCLIWELFKNQSLVKFLTLEEEENQIYPF